MFYLYVVYILQRVRTYDKIKRSRFESGSPSPLFVATLLACVDVEVLQTFCKCYLLRSLI